jgi:hypothetical protein
MQVSWPLTRIFAVANQAIGVPVLTELYERMKATPIEIDLADLWQDLGVEVQDGTVRFHDTAPLAAARRAIIAAAVRSPPQPPLAQDKAPGQRS